MEVYFEKNITNHSIDKHKKRNTVLKICKIVSVVLIFIVGFIILAFYNWSAGDPPNTILLILKIFLAVGIMSIPIVMFLIFGKLINNLNSEYDYYVAGDVFRIMRVINRQKRKKHLEIPVSSIASVGLIDDENFERYSNDKTVKKVNAFCNYDAELGYIYASDGGEKKLVTIELDSELLINLKKSMPTLLIDDSAKPLLKAASK